MRVPKGPGDSVTWQDVPVVGTDVVSETVRFSKAVRHGWPSLNQIGDTNGNMSIPLSTS